MSTIVFIDGNSTHRAARIVGIEIDWKRVAAAYAGFGLYYYTTIWTEKDDDTAEQDFIPLKPVLDFLAYNGYVVTTKMIKEPAPAKNLGVNTTPEMIVDMMERAVGMEQVILFGSSPDLSLAVEFLQRKGVLVGVVSTKEEGHCSDRLRRQANFFLDLKEHSLLYRKTTRDTKVNAD